MYGICGKIVLSSAIIPKINLPHQEPTNEAEARSKDSISKTDLHLREHAPGWVVRPAEARYESAATEVRIAAAIPLHGLRS